MAAFMEPSQGSAEQKIQVVDAEGQFCTSQVETFVGDVGLPQCKQGDYQVVAIMGPQSSGKSTLLNHVFGTSFVMMDALAGRQQTTKGIWMSRSSKVTDLVTLVMDLEGSDGRERGEDDTNFERQIALFALAVADVLIVNIWCHDIGREQGAGKPLLRTIFQVNLKLFAPDPGRKRSVLLFVIRDKTKTPMAKLVEVLEEDLNCMWDSISKPPAYVDSKLTDFFEVQYAGMAHYEERYEDFLADAVVLRRRFSPDDDASLVRPDEHLPGGAFALSVHSIWDTIRQQKDLNLPAHKVMVANIRCGEIARDQLAAFQSDQAWVTLAREAGAPVAADPAADPAAPFATPAVAAAGAAPATALVPGFNTRLTQLMDSCIQGYLEDALYFDLTVRGEKQAQLVEQLADTVAPAVAAQTRILHDTSLQALRTELDTALAVAAGSPATPLPFTTTATQAKATAVAGFKKAFADHLALERKGWDGKDALASFEAASDLLVLNLRAQRITDATAAAVKQVGGAVSGPVLALLDTCGTGLWPRLHAACKSAAEAAEKKLLQGLSGFSLSPAETAQLHAAVRDAATARMEAHVREAALTRMSRMKDRFTEQFTLDASKAPRMWRPHDNIPAIASSARLAAARLLAQLAVIYPPSDAEPTTNAGAQASQAPGEGDNNGVEAAVMRLALSDLQAGGGTGDVSTAESGVGAGADLELLSLAAWPGVDEQLVLLSPQDVRTSWRDFMSASNTLIQQAQAAQQAARLAGSRAPPLWALAAILVLGWNEFMAVLWNPVYLILGAVVFLFLRSLYLEMDVEGEMARGPLPGALALASKLAPSARAVVNRTVEAVQGFARDPERTFDSVRNLARELELPGLSSPAPSRPAESSASAAVGGPVDGGSGHAGEDASAGQRGATGNVSAAGLARRRVPASGQE